jgi:hypothetical protein
MRDETQLVVYQIVSTDEVIHVFVYNSVQYFNMVICCGIGRLASPEFHVPIKYDPAESYALLLHVFVDFSRYFCILIFT